MNLSNLAKPVVAAALLAAFAVGCAAPTEEDVAVTETGSTAQAITGAEGLSIASGVFGIANGAFTAYTTLDSFIRYGAPSPTDAILGDLAKANAALASLQTSQNEQFRQLKIDSVMGSLNLTELAIADAWSQYEGSTDKASFSPSTLTWNDFNNLDTKLASMNGTTDAFSLIKDGMLQTSGGIADDPLGTYALRMRTRMAQAAFLLTVKAPITPAQQAKYDAALARLEASFARATRAYFVAKTAPALATSNVSACHMQFWGGYAYDTPGGNTNSGWSSEGQCELDRRKWASLNLVNARTPIVNTVASQQDALTTGKWKRRPGTVVVKSASMESGWGAVDITKDMNLLCNSVENCSFPVDIQLQWLGGNPVIAWSGGYTVTYGCGDDKGDRSMYFPAGDRTVALTCNLQAAVSGVYQSTAHDANPGRGPDDTLFVESVANSTEWTYRTGGETDAPLAMKSYGVTYDSFGTSAGNVPAKWNRDGRVIRLGRPGASTTDGGFDFIAPSAETLPTIPQQ